MAYDFNSASEQRSGDLIADGTIAPVHLTIRPGNSGEGGWLKRSKSGDSMALDCEFTVTEGPNAKRKFWSLFTVEGTTEGHQKAADISASRIRAILESAHGVRPDDESEAARNARRIASWGARRDDAQPSAAAVIAPARRTLIHGYQYDSYRRQPGHQGAASILEAVRRDLGCEFGCGDDR